jgi:hypothetical protein
MRNARILTTTVFPLLVVCAVVAACTATPEHRGQGAAGPGATTSTPDATTPDAVDIAGTQEIPKCTVYVDASASGSGTASDQFATIAEAVAAADDGGVICVAEGAYPENVDATKPVTLAGGFQAGRNFEVRDSAQYVSKATGTGSGSFVSVQDPGPVGLIVVDGFEISGYAQGIKRDSTTVQPFNITHNYFHENNCPAGEAISGAGFSMVNVTATIEGNVFRDNHCFRGGAGFIADPAKGSDVTFANNVVDRNSGDEAESAHGGGIYLFATKLTITGNVFTDNTVTGWGGGLFVGSDPSADQHTTASLSWNVFRGNKAGNAGGGFFCDDGATCTSDHDLFDENCGSNVFLDSAYAGGPTIASFDHMTNVNALAVGCGAPGAGIQTDHGRDVPDAYEVKNSIFFNNADGGDVNAGCSDTCESATVTISTSMVQTEHAEGIPVTFGSGIVEPADPLFVDAANGDYHLQSTNGHFTAGGDVKDSSSSPALGMGADGEELGIYGGSSEASK